MTENEIKAAVEHHKGRREKMSSVERAIEDLQQRFSGARGLAKLGTPKAKIEAGLAAQPEYVVLAELKRLQNECEHNAGWREGKRKQYEDLERRWKTLSDICGSKDSEIAMLKADMAKIERGMKQRCVQAATGVASFGNADVAHGRDYAVAAIKRLRFKTMKF